MTQRLDMTGWKGNGLEVIEYAGLDHARRTMWKTRCVCGKEFVAMGHRLKYGKTISCGCIKAQKCRDAHIKHNGVGTKLYDVWHRMRQRCNNPNIRQYKDYGGRGIKVCERWENSFEAFREDMGEPPPGYSLDRKDNNGNYCPENCEWRTRTQQGRNKRNNRIIEFKGEAHTIPEWAEITGISKHALRLRHYQGWDVQRMLTTPQGVRRGKNRKDVPEQITKRNKARHAVYLALRSGKLVKPSQCEHEGCPETKLQAHHHHGYEPEHALDVQWFCSKHHVREWSLKFTVGNETLTLKEWSEKTGIPKATLRERFESPNWTPEESVTTPIHYNNKKGWRQPAFSLN